MPKIAHASDLRQLLLNLSLKRRKIQMWECSMEVSYFLVVNIKPVESTKASVNTEKR